MIKVSNLSVKFDTKFAIKNINLHIKEGEIIKKDDTIIITVSRKPFDCFISSIPRAEMVVLCVCQSGPGPESCALDWMKKINGRWDVCEEMGIVGR